MKLSRLMFVKGIKMSKRLMVLLVLILTTTSCLMAPKRPETSLPNRLIEQTVSLVGYSELSGGWRTYCTGVWVDSKTILTAYHCAAAAKVMSLPEDEQEDADALGQKLEAVGAPIQYATKDSFTNVLHKAATSHFQAQVVAGDGDLDLALIEVSGSPSEHRSATLADFEPKVGEEIVIMGHPAGIEFTYAHGYVSAYRSDIDPDILDIRGPFMQVNAGISGGNSGGGIYNSAGQLVGIVSFVSPRAHVQGFAIPMGSIRRFLEEYKKNKKAGEGSAEASKCK